MFLVNLSTEILRLRGMFQIVRASQFLPFLEYQMPSVTVLPKEHEILLVSKSLLRAPAKVIGFENRSMDFLHEWHSTIPASWSALIVRLSTARRQLIPVTRNVYLRLSFNLGVKCRVDRCWFLVMWNHASRLILQVWYRWSPMSFNWHCYSTAAVFYWLKGNHRYR